MGTFFLLAWQKPLLPRTNPRDGASLEVGLAHSTGASPVWVSTLTGVSRGRHPHPVASSMTHRLFITASLAASGAAVMRLGRLAGDSTLALEVLACVLAKRATGVPAEFPVRSFYAASTPSFG